MKWLGLKGHDVCKSFSNGSKILGVPIEREREGEKCLTIGVTRVLVFCVPFLSMQLFISLKYFPNKNFLKSPVGWVKNRKEALTPAQL